VSLTCCRRNLSQDTLTIGAGNLFQVGCRIECLQIGDKNVFEVKSRVGPAVVRVGNGCVVGTTVSIGFSDASLNYAIPIPENDFQLANGTVAYRVDGTVHFLFGKSLEEQHQLHVSRYLFAMQDEQSRSALKIYHKLKA